VPDAALDNLPALLKKLPDGRYRIYLSEDGRTRLVIDVVVQGGRPIDPAQDSGGTQDRPPSSQIEYRPAPLVAAGAGAAAGATGDGASGSSANGSVPPEGSANSAAPAGALRVSVPGAPSLEKLPGSGGSGQSGDGASYRPKPAKRGGETSWELAAAGVGLTAVGLEARSEQVDRVMARLGKRSLGKAARLGRRLRRAADRLPK